MSRLAKIPLEIFKEVELMVKKDEVIAEQEFEIKLPSKTQYVILQDSKEQTKAKLRIQATRTRY